MPRLDSRAARAANAAPLAPALRRRLERRIRACSTRWPATSSTSPRWSGVPRRPRGSIVKRAYSDKAKQISAKYDPQIDLDDKEAGNGGATRSRCSRSSCIKYPNDKRWTPDAMFRLAELYYEKSAEEYLDADEAYKKAID